MTTTITDIPDTDLRALIDLQRSNGLAGGTVYDRAAALALNAGCTALALTDDHLAERLLVAVCRADDPSSRGNGIWRWTVNTARRAAQEDRIDGSCATWCNAYPMTRKAKELMDESVREHLRHLREVLSVDLGD